MEIVKGSLDHIYRPASSEQTGNRVSPAAAAPFELLVLSNDSAYVQQSCSGEIENGNRTTGPDKDQSVAEITEGKNENLKSQRAFEEMRRSDEISSAEIIKEKEIRRQTKQLKTRQWQELQQKSDSYPECTHEALNTKSFLAWEAHTCKDEEDHFGPSFETQVPDYEHDGGNQDLEQRSGTNTEGLQFVERNNKTPPKKNEQKDFIHRHIESVSSDAGQVLLTRAEKERSAELLQEINAEEEDSASGTDSEEAMWATSVSAGQGYTPEPSDSEQSMEIDSKIRSLFPAEEFHSSQSSYTDLSGSQGPGSKVGWKHDGDRQPGEKVSQDIKERRESERSLQDIQQQSDILGGGQGTTNESADLTEEQLLCSSDECERTKSWSQDKQRTETVPSEP